MPSHISASKSESLLREQKYIERQSRLALPFSFLTIGLCNLLSLVHIQLSRLQEVKLKLRDQAGLHDFLNPGPVAFKILIALPGGQVNHLIET